MTSDRRQKQLESLILRAFQKRLARGINDPRIRGLITATRAEITDDLKRVRVFVSVMPADKKDLTMHGLKAATGKLRRDIMDDIHIRDMPALEIAYDDGLAAQNEVIRLLAEARRADEDAGIAATEPEEGNGG